MKILLLVLGLTSIIFMDLSLAEITSISSEVDVIENGLSFTEITISCSGTVTKRVVRKRVIDSLWCDRRIKEMCSSTKVGIGQKVCGYRISRTGQQLLMTSPNVASATNIDEQKLNQEQEIQKKQLLIDMERLELRKKELELYRKQLELSRK